MDRFNPWAGTPINREEKIADGKWIDVTNHFLGNKSKSGMVNICMSFDFLTRKLHGSFSQERVEFLRERLRECRFELARNKEVFECECVRSVENFRGQEVICFTFF